MADVIDSLVVALGIDSREYEREIKKFRDDRKRLSEEEDRQNREAERTQSRMLQNMRNLRNETAGFLFALAGANSLRQFSMDLITSDAAVGRLAHNLGMATSDVSAWGGALRSVGGDANSAYNALRTMRSAIEELNLTGRLPNDADYKGLGLTGNDLTDPETMLLKISDAAGKIPRAEFTARLKRLGLDEDTITLLAKGRGEIGRLLAEQRRLGVATEESARKAQQFETAMANLQTKMKEFGRVVLVEVGPSLEKFLTWMTESEEGTYGLAVAFGVVAVATTGWLGPLAALSFALGTLVGDLGGVAGALNIVNLGFETMALQAQALYHEKRAELYGDANPEAKMRELEKVQEIRGRLLEIAESKEAQTARGSAGHYDNPNGWNRQIERWMGGSSSGGAGTPWWLRVYDQVTNRGPHDGNPERKPRGQRAVALNGNNPGGINDGNFARSQPGYAGNNGRYAAFWTMADGIAAQRALLSRYVRQGYDTPLKIANRWAPAADGNNPSQYAADIARRMGIGVNDRIGQAELNAFQHAQAIGENHRYGRVRPAPPPRSGAAGVSKISSSTTSIGEIKVYTAATDADGIARDMRGALAQRGLVTQANTGLVA